VVILGYLAIAFKIWMFIDALRRRVSPLWYLVLAFPAGDFIYFFAVKARDYNVRPGPPPGQDPKPDLGELERAVELSPSFHNRARLAWALLDAEQYARAQEVFDSCLVSHAGDREALFGRGICLLEQERHAEAVEALAEIVDRSLSYHDYGAALALVEALFCDGRPEEGLELLEAVVRNSLRLEHMLTLARYQLRDDRPDGARRSLERAIADFESQPDYVRRRQGAIATEARRMLRGLDAAEGGDEPKA